MAKVKPQRITSINNTIDELKAEQDMLLKTIQILYWLILIQFLN